MACYGVTCTLTVGRDSSVGIATAYGLDGPGIESRSGRNFPHSSIPALRPTHTIGTGSIPGIKWPGRGVDHPPSTSAEVKERVELYTYSTSEPSWHVIGWPLPLRTFVSPNRILRTTRTEVFEDNKTVTSGIPDHWMRQSVLSALILVFEVFSEVKWPLYCANCLCRDVKNGDITNVESDMTCW